MATQNVSFFAPGFDDQIEQANIDRQRKLAEALRLQSQQPSQGVQAGPVYTPPSWTQGLARLLQGYQSGQMQRTADTKQSALAQAMQARNQDEAKSFFATLRGTPATPATPETDGNNPSAYVPAQAATAAVPGDQNRAIEMALSAKSPMVQAYGGQLATGQLQQQQMMDKLAAALRMAGGGAPTAQGAPAAGAPVGAASQGQPAAAAGASGAAPSIGGVNPLAFALTMTGDPSLAKAGELVAKANEPLVNRGFGLNKLNPVTGNYELDPGSLQGIKDVENAKADIAAAHDMVEVKNQDGTISYVRRSQLAGPKTAAPAAPPFQRPPIGAPATALPVVAAPVAGGNRMAAQPGDTDRVAALKTEFAQAQDQLANPARYMSPYALEKDPDMSQARQRAQDNIAGLTREMKAAGIASAPAAAPVYGQSTTEFHLQADRGKTLAEQEAKINSDADSALAKIAQNNKMIDLIPSITTGPGAKSMTTVRTLAQNLGVDIGDPAPNQEFEKYAIKGALEGAKQIYGARLTNQDVMTQISSNPGATMADKALYELIKYDNMMQQRHLDKQKEYFSFTGPKEQFGMYFNQKYPLMGLTAPAPGQTAGQTAPGAPAPVLKPTPKSSKLQANPDGSFTYRGQ